MLLTTLPYLGFIPAPNKPYAAPVPAPIALPNAHAHNDYQHEHPLADALAKGFTSVEADVHLVDGELYLGHWFPQVSSQRTLRALYLNPLGELMTRQGGKVYPSFEGVFYLMIDVKTNALETYLALRRLLLEFPVFQNNLHFKVFISGNRAIAQIVADSARVAGLDGRLADLHRPTDSKVMPVVSDNFRKFFEWRGEGAMPAQEQQLLRLMANATHRQGQKLRFWAVPDLAAAWEVLLDAGVDLISTDRLQDLEQFLLKRDGRTAPR